MNEDFSRTLCELPNTDVIFYQVQISEIFCKQVIQKNKLHPTSQGTYEVYEKLVKFIKFAKPPTKWKSIKVHLDSNDKIEEKIIPEVISLWKVFPEDVVSK